MTECKLPLDAKNPVWRVKPNSRTVITEQEFDMKVQYYHWISAWSGSAVTCFSWKPVFLCLAAHTFQFGGRKESASNNCRRFGQFLNMSSSQSEAIARTSPRVNQADAPLDPSVTAIFFSFVHKLQNIWNDSLRLEPDMQTWLRRITFSMQALLLCVPLTGKLCITPPLLIWGSPNGRQFLSLGISR